MWLWVFKEDSKLSLFKGGEVHQGLISLEINLSSGDKKKKKKDRLVLESSSQYWNLEKNKYLQTFEKKVLKN